MRRLVTSPQIAAFTIDTLAMSSPPPLEMQNGGTIEIGEPETPEPAPQALTATQCGDVLEVTGVNAEGKRVVVKRIPLGKKIGNRLARLTEKSRMLRQSRKAR